MNLPRGRDWTVFLGVAGFFLCCDLRLLTTGYLELDDLGRVQVGYNLWAADGRLLTAGLMALLSFGGRMVDISPLPQLGAIACMGLAGVLLFRASPALGRARPALAAILLFATPFYLQNMSYVFDSLSMTAAMLLALWASLLLRGFPAGAVLALLASLLFYQPAVNVFLCFAAAAILFALARQPTAARALARRAVLVSAAAASIDAALILAGRLGGLLFFPPYQARHAALVAPAAALRLLPANAAAMLSLAARMIPPASFYGALALCWIAGALLLALRPVLLRRGWRDLALFAAAATVLLSGFVGPMLLLRDPVVQPRTLLGVGGMLAASGWLSMRLLPSGRAGAVVVAGALLLAGCFARDGFAYGALVRDLDRAEAATLPGIARALNDEQAATGLHPLQIVGAMPWPPSVQHGLQRAPALAPLFDNPLDGIKWFGVALLAEYGLEDGIVFRNADSGAAPCARYRETGPGYAVGHDARSLVLVFRDHCPSIGGAAPAP